MSLVAVHLYGPLADKYGAQHAFAIGNPAEAVAALDANYPGFVADFVQSEIYYIHADGDWREGEQAAILPVGREIHLVPHIEGEGPAIGLLVGALFPSLVGATIFGVAATTLIGSIIFTGLMIGVSFLLAPKAPKMGQDTEKDENFAFSGPANVTEQGAAVPLVYGRVHCGSVVISAGLEPATKHVPASETWPNGFPATPPTNTPAGVPAPPGGWPAIVIGPSPPWSWHPQGWESYKSEIVVVGGVDKMVFLYTPPPPAFSNDTYLWGPVKGYYVIPGTQQSNDSPEEDEWVPTHGKDR